MVASGCTTKEETIQAAAILHCLGQEVREIFNTLDMVTANKKNPVKIMEALDRYFLPKKNEWRKMASYCEFDTMKEELIKDRIVCGIYNYKVKDLLLRKSDLTLTRVIQICKAAEETEKHIEKLVEQAKAVNVSEMAAKRYSGTEHQSANKRYAMGQQANRNSGRGGRNNYNTYAEGSGRTIKTEDNNDKARANVFNPAQVAVMKISL